MRKALGEYVNPADQDSFVDRWYFLAAANSEVPALAAGLAEIFTESRPAPDVDLRSMNYNTEFIGLTGDMLTEDGHPFARLKCGAEEWARKFNLTRDGEPPKWVVQAAGRTFSWWSHLGMPNADILSGGGGSTGPCIDYSLHVRPFQITEWNPTFGESSTDTWAAIKDELAALENHLREQLDRIENEAQKSGLVKASTRESRNPFKWAARFHVGGEAAGDIAVAFRVDESTVRRGVGRIISSIGLDLRTEPLGRPRKKSRVSASKQVRETP